MSKGTCSDVVHRQVNAVSEICTQTPGANREQIFKILLRVSIILSLERLSVKFFSTHDTMIPLLIIFIFVMSNVRTVFKQLFGKNAMYMLCDYALLILLLSGQIHRYLGSVELSCSW